VGFKSLPLCANSSAFLKTNSIFSSPSSNKSAANFNISGRLPNLAAYPSTSKPSSAAPSPGTAGVYDGNGGGGCASLSL